jgi:ABC-type antimicrobial peptide transport system permease subunit
MKIVDSISYACSTIKNRKFRSFLTILGVVIGIAAIVAMQSLSNGFEQSVNDNFDTLSTDVITIQSNRGQTGTDFGPIQGGSSSVPLYENDTQSVETIEYVENAAAVMQKSASILIDNEPVSITIYGVDFNDYPQIFPTFELEAGNIPSQNSNRSILAIGLWDPYNNGTKLTNVKDNLTFYWNERTEFGTMTFNKTIGVDGLLKEAGGLSNLGTPSDNALYIDIGLFQSWYEEEQITMMVVKVSDDNDAVIEQVSEDLKELFDDGIMIITLGSMISTVNSTLEMMTVFLTAIASIALIVAGVGIMNIMTVSLMERTREIGILKAIGMKDREILFSFILETIFIGILGSAGGIGLGWLMANGAAQFGASSSTPTTGMIEQGPLSAVSSINPIFTSSIIILAFVFGIGISLVFGYLPARNAAKKPPVEALRYE